MKLLSLVLALYSTTAFCSSPTVTCAVWYSKADSEGNNVEGTREDDIEVNVARLKNEVGIKDIRSFKVETSLGQNFMGDGGGLGIYNLKVQISKGDSKSKLDVTLSRPHELYSTSLNVGNEEISMSCEAIAL